MFTLLRVYFHTLCDTFNPIPPTPVGPIPDINVKYCDVYSYTLSTSLFHDDVDVEAKQMKLLLTDSKGNSFDYINKSL